MKEENKNSIINYIKSQREKGTADEDIKKELVNAGWSEEDISIGFSELNEEKPTTEPQKEEETEKYVNIEAETPTQFSQPSPEETPDNLGQDPTVVTEVNTRNNSSNAVKYIIVAVVAVLVIGGASVAAYFAMMTPSDDERIAKEEMEEDKTEEQEEELQESEIEDSEDENDLKGDEGTKDVRDETQIEKNDVVEEKKTAEGRHQPYNKLAKLADIEDILDNADYEVYTDHRITFNYPKNWKIEYNSDLKLYIIKFGESSIGRAMVNLGITEDYVTSYMECLENRSEKENSLRYSKEDYYCSENYSLDNLDKVLSGKYIDYFSTGGMPPGGVGRVSIRRFFDESFIELSFFTDTLQFYPKAREIYENKGFDAITDEQRKTISEEQEHYHNIYYKIIRSAILK